MKLKILQEKYNSIFDSFELYFLVVKYNIHKKNITLFNARLINKKNSITNKRIIVKFGPAFNI